MVDLVLPRRVPSGPGQTRRARLPSAADVPRAAQVSDPGLPRQAVPGRVPAGAFGAASAQALEGFGQSVADTAIDVGQALERQQARHDATKTSESLLAFERGAMEELRRRQVEDDPARPKFMDDFEADLLARREKALAGLTDVSEGAKTDLGLKIDSSLNGIVDSAGRLSLAAGQARASDAIEATVNQLSAQAARDPDFLNEILAEADIRLAPFKGAMTADQERDARLKARQDIIRSSIEGLVLSGRTGDAQALLDSGRFDEELTREQRARADALIESGERQAVKDADKAERDAEKALKEAQDIRAAEITDGILEGRTNDFDLDTALRERSIDGKQFIAARKLLKAQEKESATVDDPNVVLALTNELDAGTLTKAQVVDAFADQLITAATMNRLRGDIDSGPDDSLIKEQRRMLQDAVAGTSGLGAILGEDTTRRVNQAVQEYNERVRGPGKEDPLKVRKDIESRAAEPRTLDSLFRPRFMVGPDKESMDSEATLKATLKAFRAGEITAAQLLRETEIINQIDEARIRQ